jgi:RNAse (barnase) inhibitor barstar
MIPANCIDNTVLSVPQTDQYGVGVFLRKSHEKLKPPGGDETMQLQTVRPNIVQSIRAYRVEDLMKAAENTHQHFLYANLIDAQSKQDVFDSIAESFLLPVHFGKNLDALYDCITDVVSKAGFQPGFVIVLEQLPDNPKFDRETREQLLDVFRDAADFWAERRIPFRCFYSFQ